MGGTLALQALPGQKSQVLFWPRPAALCIDASGPEGCPCTGVTARCAQHPWGVYNRARKVDGEAGNSACEEKGVSWEAQGAHYLDKG